VTAAAVIRWAFDSIAVGNGSVSIALSLTRTDGRSS
jgi:hypothetical protein